MVLALIKAAETAWCTWMWYLLDQGLTRLRISKISGGAIEQSYALQTLLKLHELYISCLAFLTRVCNETALVVS